MLLLGQPETVLISRSGFCWQFLQYKTTFYLDYQVLIVIYIDSNSITNTMYSQLEMSGKIDGITQLFS